MSPPTIKTDWSPFAHDIHERQLAGLLADLADLPRDALIVDLGCGDGRILVPIARLGRARCIGIDNDVAAIEACRISLAGTTAHLIHSDFVDESFHLPAPADVVLCLGNTFMLIHDPLHALALLRRIRAALRPAGRFVIDNIPGQLWPCVANGDWITGISEEVARDDDCGERSQLVWARDDNVFAIRRGDAIDPDSGAPRPDRGDQLARLWTMGELRLLAAAVPGFAEPVVDARANLIRFSRNR